MMIPAGLEGRPYYFHICYQQCEAATSSELGGSEDLDDQCVDNILYKSCFDACSDAIASYMRDPKRIGIYTLLPSQVQKALDAAKAAAAKIKAECQKSPQPVPEDATEESPQPDSDSQKILLALAQITNGLKAVQQTIQDVTSDQDDGVDWEWMGLGVGVAVAAPLVYLSAQAVAGVLAGLWATSSS